LGVGSQRARVADQGGQEAATGQRLCDHVGDRRAGEPPPGGIDQQRAEDGGEDVRAEHEQQGQPGLLNAAHPAVAGRGEEQPGGSERGDAQPAGGGFGGGRITREGGGQRSGEGLGEHGQQDAGGQREPGGLDPLGDGRGAVTGPEAAGGPSGGAVRHQRAEPDGHRHDGAADGDRGERNAPEVPDDGGVDQHVERLGREHDERRQCQPGYLPGGGDVSGPSRGGRGSFRPGRRAHG
jgi:hypothetical protein